MEAQNTVITDIDTYKCGGLKAVTLPEKVVEERILQALLLVKKAVADADPEAEEIVVKLPPSITSDPSKQRGIAAAVARRIRSLSPDWMVCARAKTIRMTRHSCETIGRKFCSGGFSISAVQKRKLEVAGGEIDEVVSFFLKRFVQVRGSQKQIEVKFDGICLEFYVLRAAAQRLQYYNADWIIYASKRRRSIIAEGPKVKTEWPVR